MLDDEVGELSPIPAMNRNNDVNKRNSDRFLRWCCVFKPYFVVASSSSLLKNAVAGAGDSSPLPDISELKNVNIYKDEF